jgi:hypothetical protein
VIERPVAVMDEIAVMYEIASVHQDQNTDHVEGISGEKMNKRRKA